MKTFCDAIGTFWVATRYFMLRALDPTETGEESHHMIGSSSDLLLLSTAIRRIVINHVKRDPELAVQGERAP